MNPRQFRLRAFANVTAFTSQVPQAVENGVLSTHGMVIYCKTKVLEQNLYNSASFSFSWLEISPARPLIIEGPRSPLNTLAPQKIGSRPDQKHGCRYITAYVWKLNYALLLKRPHLYLRPTGSCQSENSLLPHVTAATQNSGSLLLPQPIPLSLSLLSNQAIHRSWTLPCATIQREISTLC